MRITLDLLGHHVEFSIDHPSDAPGEREGSADALVERNDPHMPTIGFAPQYRWGAEPP